VGLRKERPAIRTTEEWHKKKESRRRPSRGSGVGLFHLGEMRVMQERGGGREILRRWGVTPISFLIKKGLQDRRKSEYRTCDRMREEKGKGK